MKRLNKTLLALFVALSLCLTTLMVPVFAAEADRTVCVVNNGSTITASTAIDNTSGSADFSAKLIIAQYNGNSLALATVGSATAKAGGETVIVANADVVTGAEVKCFLFESGKLSPLKKIIDTAASTPELEGIKVNGELIDGFSTSKVAYEMEVNSAKIPTVEGVVESDMYYAKTSYVNSGSTAVATVTVKNANGAAGSKSYTVTFTLPKVDMHVVVGATNEEDFESLGDSDFSTTKVSKAQVSTYHVTGTGKLYSDLQPVTNGVYKKAYETVHSPSNSQTKWGFEEVDASLLGCDYFIFGYNGASAQFGAASIGPLAQQYTSSSSALKDTPYDGLTLVDFELDAPAEVSILTNAVVNDYLTDGYSHSTSGITYRQDIINMGSLRGAGANKYTQTFPAGKVSIKYYTELGDAQRNPIVVIKPLATTAFESAEKAIQDFAMPTEGFSYAKYCEHVGVEPRTDAMGTGLQDMYLKWTAEENLSAGSKADIGGTRTVGYISPVLDVEGCEYLVLYNANYLPQANGSSSQGVNWIVEAITGSATRGIQGSSMNYWYGFNNTAGQTKLASFTAGCDADIIVLSAGSISSLVSKEGYVGGNVGTTVMEIMRNGSLFVPLNHMYVKSVKKGDEVNVYNVDDFDENGNSTRGGTAFRILIVRPK